METTVEELAEKILRALTRNTHHTIAAIYDGEEAANIVAYELERLVVEVSEACAQIVEGCDRVAKRHQIADSIRARYKTSV